MLASLRVAKNRPRKDADSFLARSDRKPQRVIVTSSALPHSGDSSAAAGQKAARQELLDNLAPDPGIFVELVNCAEPVIPIRDNHPSIRRIPYQQQR